MFMSNFCCSSLAMAECFRILTTFRADAVFSSVEDNSHIGNGEYIANPFYLLKYHRDRILAAAMDFGWTELSKSLEGSEGIRHFYDLVKVHMLGQNGALTKGPQRVRMISLNIDFQIYKGLMGPLGTYHGL